MHVPTIWREELWHPLIVHFPIVTLLLASVAGLLFLLFRKTRFADFLRRGTASLLVIGVVTGWVAIYTGLTAYNVEVRKLCDPDVLHLHRQWGYVALWFYSGALMLYLVHRYFIHRSVLLFNSILVLILVAGAGSLCYSAHAGAEVVYQQGAGVYQPSEDCSEFVQ